MKKILLSVFFLLTICTNHRVGAQINSLVNNQEKKDVLQTIRKNSAYLVLDTSKILNGATFEQYEKLLTDSIILIKLYAFNNIKPVDRKDFYKYFHEYFSKDSSSAYPFYYVVRYANDTYESLGTIEIRPILSGDTFIDKQIFLHWCSLSDHYFDEILRRKKDSFVLWSSYSFLNEFVFMGEDLYAIMKDGSLLSANNYFELFFPNELQNRYRKRTDKDNYVK